MQIDERISEERERLEKTTIINETGIEGRQEARTISWNKESWKKGAQPGKFRLADPRETAATWLRSEFRLSSLRGQKKRNPEAKNAAKLVSEQTEYATPLLVWWKTRVLQRDMYRASRRGYHCRSID